MIKDIPDFDTNLCVQNIEKHLELPLAFYRHLRRREKNGF